MREVGGQHLALLLWLTLWSPATLSQPCLLAAVPPQPSRTKADVLSCQEHPSIFWAHVVPNVVTLLLRELGSLGCGVQGYRSEAGLAEGPGAILSCGVLNS